MNIIIAVLLIVYILMLIYIICIRRHTKQMMLDIYNNRKDIIDLNTLINLYIKQQEKNEFNI